MIYTVQAPGHLCNAALNGSSCVVHEMLYDWHPNGQVIALVLLLDGPEGGRLWQLGPDHLVPQRSVLEAAP